MLRDLQHILSKMIDNQSAVVCSETNNFCVIGRSAFNYVSLVSINLNENGDSILTSFSSKRTLRSETLLALILAWNRTNWHVKPTVTCLRNVIQWQRQVMLFVLPTLFPWSLFIYHPPPPPPPPPSPPPPPLEQPLEAREGLDEGTRSLL